MKFLVTATVLVAVATAMNLTGIRRDHFKAKNLAEKLFNNSLDIAKSALDTCFIQGIKNGTLDPRDYGAYAVQDSVYISHGGTILNLLAQKAQIQGLPDLKAFASGQAKLWKESAEQMLQQWHLKDPETVVLCDAAKNYLAFEKRILDNYHPYYTILSLLPCNMLWIWLGRELKPFANANNVYSFWIDEFSKSNNVAAVAAWAKFLEAHKTRFEWDTSSAIFREGMDHEVKFFRSACKEMHPEPAQWNKI